MKYLRFYSSSNTQKYWVKSITVAILAAGVTDIKPAQAANLFTATSFNDLSNYINTANNGDTIDIQGLIQLSGSLPQISKNLNFVGTGSMPTVDGQGKYEDFFVKSGIVTFSNLTIANGLAQGGNGGFPGGGGGAGLGGGLFINSGAVIATNVTFSGN